ncbi:class I adenylate-forming enzyme family protein [Actinomadura sp. CNU-125]|uniref:class I adenylate-forming enzyme family protein n=1 Tax=Actinomadura sp. CNU-125 TaxID=1904961 RepID=UPI0021CCFC5E|nr:class I adenylate-forming enzyme family protein [Actinomadura sp. CNU-125]
MDRLTAPGGPFPVTWGVHDGRPAQVFADAPATLRDLFLATKAFGDRDALVYGDERWTYAEQWDQAVRAADGLARRFGVGPGDRVAIAGRNYPEWCLAFWAVQLLGGVAVPLNAWLTAPELEVLLDDCAPALVVADAERLDRLAGLPGTTGRLRGLVGMRAPAREGVVPFADLVRGDGPVAVPEAARRPDDIATIMYTSGTTGRPKGVVSTHLSHGCTVLSMRLRSAARANLAGGGRPAGPPATLLTFPLFHIAGLTALTSNVHAGRCIVSMYRFDAAEAVRLIAAERVQDVTGPPTVIRGLIDAIDGSDLDLSSLIALGSGGSQAPASQIRGIRALLGGRVGPGTAYGLTETTSAVVSIGGADLVERPTSIGRPLPTVEVRVCDPDGAPVPPGGPGELWIRGAQVALGYHGRPRESAESFRDGWFRTGDQVVQDDAGYLYLVGRLKDVVIRGGENVYCAEVEAAIEDHPGVAEAAVVGRPHPTLGEEVCAVVRLRPGRTADAEALRAHLSGRLAAFKIPVAVRFTTEDLPRNPSGKLLKAGLRPPG